MKNKITILFFGLLFPILAFGQKTQLAKPTIKLEISNPMDRKDVIRQFKSKIHSKLSKDFYVESRSPFVLDAWFDNIKSKTMEGMETYTYSEVNYNFKLTNIVTGSEKEWTFKTKGKSENEYKAVQKSFSNAMKGKEEFGKVLTEIQAHIEEELTNNCSAYVAKARDFFGEEDTRGALRLLININNESPCYTARKELEKTILEKQQADYCKKEIQQITIMVNSGEKYQLRNAVNKLLRISPDAPCANEAIKLSEQIGEKMQGNTGKTATTLNNYQQIMREKKNDDWLLIFLKSEK